MSNSFKELQLIARKALPRLQENLVMPHLVTRDYDAEYKDLGDTIQIRKPTILEAKDFTVGNAVTRQDVTENTVPVKLDKIATVDISLNALEAVHNWSAEKFNSDFIEPAVAAIAEKINGAGCKLYSQIPNIIGGTAGTTPDGLDDFGLCRKFLNKAKAPMSDRNAIWDVEADAKFCEIGNLVKVNESGSPQALREGEIGRVYGINNYMTQAITQHVKAAAGTILLKGAATKGATSITCDGITTAMKVGDIFTIGSDTTKYTVSACTALDSGEQDLTIIPALQANAADNAAVTVGASATNNLIFHKAGIVFVTRPLAAPQGGAEGYTVSDGNYSLRVVLDYDSTYKKQNLSMDVLYNYAVVYPELCGRYLG